MGSASSQGGSPAVKKKVSNTSSPKTTSSGMQGGGRGRGLSLSEPGSKGDSGLKKSGGSVDNKLAKSSKKPGLSSESLSASKLASSGPQGPGKKAASSIGRGRGASLLASSGKSSSSSGTVVKVTNYR